MKHSKKVYLFKMKDERGRILCGFKEAENKRELKHGLAQQKMYFISAVPYSSDKIFRKKVGLDPLLMFTHRLATLIEAGVPILSAIQILWRQTDNPNLQLVISHIYNRLEEGNKISEALSDFPRIFSPMYVSLIAMAEKSGGLVEILKKLSAHLSYQKQFVSRIKKAMIYPVVVMVFAMVILTSMFAFVVPVFAKVLMSLDAELPLVTRIILMLSEWLRSPVIILGVLVVILAGFFFYRYYRRFSPFAATADRLKLKTPVVGNVIFSICLSRFIHSLSMLLESGIPIVDSFQAAKATIDNAFIEKNVTQVELQIEQGASVYEAFMDAKIFPVMMTEMIGAGESSGSIVKILKNIALHLDEEIDYLLNKLLSMMEPFLIIFVGMVVLVTLLAIYMPVFSIWENLS